MHPNRRRPPPTLNSYDRGIVEFWFRVTGHTTASPEWATAWSALTSAGLASNRSLTLRPTAEEQRAQLRSEDTAAAATVVLALSSGAHYAATAQRGSGVNAGLGVAIVLALFHTCPAVLADALTLAPTDRDDHVATELGARLLGIYDSAPAALTAQIAAARAAAGAGDQGVTWPPLVELVLNEAVRDDVFAEHIFLQLAATTGVDVGHVVLPDGRWLILRAP